MYKFSSNEERENSKRLDKVIELLSDPLGGQRACFDILAIQEIFDKAAMDALLNYIRMAFVGDWKGCWGKPKVGNMPRRIYSELSLEERKKYASAEEGYAYIWNARVIDLVRIKLLDGRDREFKPRIINQYTKEQYSLVGRPEIRNRQELIRNPFYARFAPTDSSGYSRLFELRLLNAHIMFGKGRNIAEADMKDAQLRRQEFHMLATRILPAISEKDYGTQRLVSAGTISAKSSYTILLGDYNLDLKCLGNTGPYVPEIIHMEGDSIQELLVQSDFSTNKVMPERTIREILTVQKEKTSLIKPIKIKNCDDSSVEEKKNEIMKALFDGKKYYANNYDHFTYDQKRFEGVLVSSERIDAVSNAPYYGEYDKYQKEVSDHVPVLLRFQYGG